MSSRRLMLVLQASVRAIHHDGLMRDTPVIQACATIALERPSRNWLAPQFQWVKSLAGWRRSGVQTSLQRKFPANREFYRDFYVLGPQKANSVTGKFAPERHLDQFPTPNNRENFSKNRDPFKPKQGKAAKRSQVDSHCTLWSNPTSWPSRRMSASSRITDIARHKRHVRKVPIPEIQEPTKNARCLPPADIITAGS
jgi:hypothetical protein